MLTPTHAHATRAMPTSHVSCRRSLAAHCVPVTQGGVGSKNTMMRLDGLAQLEREMKEHSFMFALVGAARAVYLGMQVAEPLNQTQVALTAAGKGTLLHSCTTESWRPTFIPGYCWCLGVAGSSSVDLQGTSEQCSTRRQWERCVVFTLGASESLCAPSAAV